MSSFLSVFVWLYLIFFRCVSIWACASDFKRNQVFSCDTRHLFDSIFDAATRTNEPKKKLLHNVWTWSGCAIAAQNSCHFRRFIIQFISFARNYEISSNLSSFVRNLLNNFPVCLCCSLVFFGMQVCDTRMKHQSSWIWRRFSVRKVGNSASETVLQYKHDKRQPQQLDSLEWRNSGNSSNSSNPNQVL